MDYQGCDDLDTIRARRLERSKGEEPPFADEAMDRFKNRMKIGDIVVVSQGNRLIRAIGRVTGEYAHHASTEYGQRRAVFVAQVAELVAWLPPEWSHLGDMAARRCSKLNEASRLAHLWASVSDAVTGATMRAGEPVVRPAATLVDELIPSITRTEAMLLLVAKLVQRSSERSKRRLAQLDFMLKGLRVVAPAPALGTSAESTTEQAWELQGASGRKERPHRLFLVEEASGQVFDATGHYDAPEQDVCLWEFTAPGDAVVAILIEGERPIPGDTLDDVLDEASSRDDVRVATRTFSRPT